MTREQIIDEALSWRGWGRFLPGGAAEVTLRRARPIIGEGWLPMDLFEREVERRRRMRMENPVQGGCDGCFEGCEKCRSAGSQRTRSKFTVW